MRMHVCTHAALASFFLATYATYVSYDLLLRTGGVPPYGGFIAREPLPTPSTYCARLRVRLWLPYALARLRCHSMYVFTPDTHARAHTTRP